MNLSRRLRQVPLIPLLSLGLAAHAHPLRGVELGRAAPEFELKDVLGKAYSLSACKGQAVVVAYYRVDQALSTRVLEALGRLRQRYPASEVVVLAVRRPDAGEAASVESARPPFPVLLDPDRELYNSWGLFVLPTTVVLDRRHLVVAAFSTFPEAMEEDLAGAVDRALGRPHAAARPSREVAPAAPPEIAMARKLLAVGRAAQAYDTLKAVLSTPSPDALVLAGEALLALGRVDEAASRGEAALQAQAQSPRASLLMGRVRTLQNRYQEAETLLKAAAQTADGSQARYRLGQLYERQGRKDAALSEYRAALERAHGP